MKSIPALSIFAVIVLVFANAKGPDKKPTDDFVFPFPLVGITRGGSDALKSAAKQIAETIGAPTYLEAEHSPTCCIWIEVTGWVPNPGEPGYFIINQAGGSIISASNEVQLKKAVERFRETARRGPHGVQVPVGMMTSYPLAAVPETAE